MLNIDYTYRVESLGESKAGNQISTRFDAAIFRKHPIRNIFFIIPPYKIKVTALFN